MSLEVENEDLNLENSNGATETTQQAVLQSVDNVKTLLTSVVGTRTHLAPSTGEQTVPSGTKVISVVIEGDGATIDGIARPDGWVRDYESNQTLNPEIVFNGNGTATIYIDYLV